MLDSWFRLTEHGTTTAREISAGFATFLTMSYILFVQPALLAGEPAAMDFGAVVTATCLTSALASLLMGIWARYPIALAPGMGINALFVYALVPAAKEAGHPTPWQAALGVVLASGLLFLLLTALGARERLMDALSPSLKAAIGAGIGLFIVFIGMRNAGLIGDHPATLVHLEGNLARPEVWVACVGLLVAAAAAARRVAGALLLGILAATATTVLLKLVLPPSEAGAALGRFELAQGLISLPPSLEPTFFAFDLAAIWLPGLLPFVFVLLFVDVFDTLGTLIGVTQQAGLLVDGRLPRAGRALATDAIATLAGACLGTSTVTSYVESAAGVEQGGRTGLVAVTVGLLFVAALFVSPLITMLGSYPPLTAAVLVLVGCSMLRSAAQIEWQDPTEATPALLILAGIPFSFSIGDGIALGFLAYPLIKLGAGRQAEVSPVLWVLAAILLGYFGFLRS